MVVNIRESLGKLIKNANSGALPQEMQIHFLEDGTPEFSFLFLLCKLLG